MENEKNKNEIELEYDNEYENSIPEEPEQFEIKEVKK